jgi:FkbM family methyltransferase
MTIRGYLSGSAIAWAGWLLSPVDFKGYWHVTRMAGRVASATDYRVIRIGQRSCFKISLRDPYWARLVSSSYDYEPEIAWAFRNFRKSRESLAFIDCGANFGYWSLLAREIYPKADVISVEANPDTFEKLEENLAINKSPAIAINAAVYDKAGEIVMIETHDDNHAGSHIGVAGESPIATTTIDDLVKKHCRHAQTVIVKLDVEGVEMEAMRGATDVIAARDVAFLYEDHGSDPHSVTTGCVIEELGLRVYFVDRDGFRPVASAKEASALKTNPKYGYNFVALSPRSTMIT